MYIKDIYFSQIELGDFIENVGFYCQKSFLGERFNLVEFFILNRPFSKDLNCRIDARDPVMFIRFLTEEDLAGHKNISIVLWAMQADCEIWHPAYGTLYARSISWYIRH